MWEEEKIILVPLGIFEEIVLNKINQMISNGDNKIYMKKKISHGMNKYLKTSLYLITAILVGFTASYAGNLVAPGSPAKTMKTLSDLYELIDTGTNTPSTDFATPETVTSTMHSIGDTYDLLASKISDIDPATILSGTTIFGVEGEASAGSPDLTWATASDTPLCWANGQYEIDNGCSVGSGFVQTPDTNLGATEYCQYLEADGETLANTAQNIWHLPTIEEYQSITDYTLYNNATEVPGFAEVTNYWSSTEYAEYPDNAWSWNLWNGYTGVNDKYNQYAVRCARLASSPR